MLIETGFELTQALSESGIVLLKLGNLLLLESNDGQKRTNEVPNCHWSGRPVLRSNAVGWCLLVHAASMPSDAAAVKSGSAHGLAETP
jgi:hypothetical protein